MGRWFYRTARDFATVGRAMREARDMNEIVGSHDLLFVTLDTLRYDVARAAAAAGETPNLARLLPGHRWEERHSPASFTYAAHHAFFAGFLPTPSEGGGEDRLLALRFEGSTTTTPRTCVLDGADIVSGLRARGYHAACIGGTGFFNKQNALGSVFPSLFDESHWSIETGVTDPRSTENQVALAQEILGRIPSGRRVFLFLNVSAIHQPNRHYLDGAKEDSIASHRRALAYVDRALEPLFAACRARSRTFAMISSDHGTAYGEDGFHGHRVGHPVVWTVPYAEFVLEPDPGGAILATP
jgi:hypothetical protein